METTKRISELKPGDVRVIERVFGMRLDAPAESLLILRVSDASHEQHAAENDDEVPAWCNVLEGMSDEDLTDFNAAMRLPIRLASNDA